MEQQPTSSPETLRTPSRRSLRGLDGFVFFLADVQTGFGPFVAVYLTESKWTQTDIGLVLTIGGLTGLVAQIPAGALVDAVRSLRATAAVALVAIGISAFALAATPVFPVVVASRIVQAGASCVLGVSVAALSLDLVGRAGIGVRLGRNASLMSIGTGLAAAGMGACGYYLSNQAVFFVAAALVGPGLLALGRIRSADLRPAAEAVDASDARPAGGGALRPGLAALARNRALVVFGACVVLFQMANASLLPLAASMLTLRSHQAATAMVATAIVVPQGIVALLSPAVASGAQRWGRKPLLLIGFAALPVRALLFALTIDPRLLVAVQALDGVSAAVLGVLTPLTIADVAARSGRFNLAQGVVGCAVGIGAAVSTTVAGWLADRFGAESAFLAMTAVAGLGLVTVLLLMPETGAAPSPVAAGSETSAGPPG